MIVRSLVGALVFALVIMGATRAQDIEFERFAAYSDQPGPTIDYSAWSFILRGIVYDVGHSDRMSPSMRPVHLTGTRMNPASRSRYRYEGNRVLFHLMKEPHLEALAQYRAELEALPTQIALSQLDRDELLAYWLNLHTVVLVDELARQYPVRRVDQAMVGGTALLDAKLITIDGVALSLNDIRYRIVAAHWDDPRVIYGFYLGAVGGPSIRNEAFEGRRVWQQLESSAREFINALRGVDAGVRGPEVSPFFQMHADLFAQGAPSLNTHLQAFGNAEVDALVDALGEPPTTLRFDWQIADLTNGRVGCGSRGMVNIRTRHDLFGNGNQSDSFNCNVIPAHTLDLVNRVYERRLEFFRNGELGRVTLRDIPTDPDQDAEAVTSEPTTGSANDG